jgi:hypothetical protein
MAVLAKTIALAARQREIRAKRLASPKTKRH